MASCRSNSNDRTSRAGVVMSASMRLRSLTHAIARALWLRPVALMALAAFFVARARADVDPLAATPNDALAAALASRGLLCAASDVFWIRGPSGLSGALTGGGRAIVAAHVCSDRRAVYCGVL